MWTGGSTASGSRTSEGPYTTAKAFVFPCSTYAEPSDPSNTPIFAENRRRSAGLLPSSRNPFVGRRKYRSFLCSFFSACYKWGWHYAQFVYRHTHYSDEHANEQSMLLPSGEINSIVEKLTMPRIGIISLVPARPHPTNSALHNVVEMANGADGCSVAIGFG